MAAETFCGFNYRFGYKAAGNIKLLREEGKRLGIRVNVIEPVIIDGEVVSSTPDKGPYQVRDGTNVPNTWAGTTTSAARVVEATGWSKKLGFRLPT